MEIKPTSKKVGFISLLIALEIVYFTIEFKTSFSN